MVLNRINREYFEARRLFHLTFTTVLTDLVENCVSVVSLQDYGAPIGFLLYVLASFVRVWSEPLFVKRYCSGDTDDSYN